MKIQTIVAALAILISSDAFAQQPANPGQDMIERTIGSLVMANANLVAQVAQAKTTIEDLQKQIAAEKAKNAKPDDPKK